MIIRLAYPRQFLVTISLVLWAVFLAACTPGDDVRARVDAAHDRNDAPPIWVVKDHNTELYLFGTVHLLPNELDWQKDDMKAVFDEAGTVFFELDSSPEALLETVLIMQQLGQQTKGRTISQKLDSYQLKLLEAVSHNGDIPIASLDSMTPWLASEFLTIAAADKAGLKADLSADEALKNRASRQKKNIVYLDDAETQIRASADLPSYVQMEMFIESMERFNSMGTELTNIANSWAKGDIDGLKLSGASSLKERSPELYESLIVKRNKNWVRKLLPFMEDSGTGFAAVGIGHLLGEDSLQDMLRDQGYTVTRYFAFQGEPVLKASPLGSVNPQVDE